MHVCLGGVGLARDDERRFQLSVLDSLFGGSLSSRLFQEVREKRGLVYSVYSFSSMYEETGLSGLYFGCRPERLEAVMETVGRELVRLVEEPVPADELQRAKEHLKGRMILGLESTSSRMTRLGKGVITETEILSLDELAARIDAVTSEQVLELAAEVYRPAALSVVGIGADESQFAARRAGGLPGRPGVGGELMSAEEQCAERRRDSGWPCPGRGGAWARMTCEAVAADDGAGPGRPRSIRRSLAASLPARRRPAAERSRFATLEAGSGRRAASTWWSTSPSRRRCGRTCLTCVRATGAGGGGYDRAERRRPGGDRARGGDCSGVPVLVAPNFAMGAVLMMQFARQAAEHFARLRDRGAAPRAQARRALGHVAAHPPARSRRPGVRRAWRRRSPSTASVCRDWWRTKRSSSAAWGRR